MAGFREVVKVNKYLQSYTDIIDDVHFESFALLENRGVFWQKCFFVITQSTRQSGSAIAHIETILLSTDTSIFALMRINVSNFAPTQVALELFVERLYIHGAYTCAHATRSQ